MTRIRKEPNKYWSKEDKLKIINEVLINCKSSYEVAKEYDISSGMLIGWIIKYNKGGLDALENKDPLEILAYHVLNCKKFFFHII